MNQIQVTRSSMPELSEYVNEIKDIWETHWLTNMGRHHDDLMDRLKEFLGTENLRLFVNGHSALELSLQALNLTGEVITTPFTFASTTHAIVRNGLEPVFCDINPDDFTIDVSKLESCVTDRTTAILPVHVYGNLCDVDEIGRIARKYGLKVIYDAAHAFGESLHGRGVAQFGDVSVFSFHATKVFNSIEGGAAAFRDPKLGEELLKLLNFGIRDEETVDGVGSNAKMNEFQAAMGVCNLRHVKDEISKRKKVCECYEEFLHGVEGIRIPDFKGRDDPNYAYYPVIIEEQAFGKSRNEVFEALGSHDIHARKYFYPLTNTFDCFYGKYSVDRTPVAMHTAKRVLCLPMYGDLQRQEVEEICRIVLTGD